VTILLLRHAHAGDRSRWDGDDRVRPLTERGVHQAQGLVSTYDGRAIDRILTSPWERCVQTIEPLAEAFHLDVEVEDALGEGTPLDVVQRLLQRCREATTVMCTHGDVLAAVVTDLSHRGVVGADGLRWPKGSTWVLEAGEEGAITRAAYLPPPT